MDFTYSNFKKLIKRYGKTNKQIAEEIVQFIDARWIEKDNISKGFIYPGGTSIKEVMTTNVEFYGYYSDYDWVVFCWLFGRMINLPKGFPMYCNDLKQESDKMYEQKKKEVLNKAQETKMKLCFLNSLSDHPNYPKQTNEHNALADARWNKQLYEFLIKL
jgi:hypothetical protein